VVKGIDKCRKATLLAATIGSELSLYSTKCFSEGKLWEGTIANSLGSYTLEKFVEEFHKFLRQKNLAKGLYSSPRFSPGYGDWSLKDQEKIISILETEPFITVNYSFILEPIKSVTALIGWSDFPREMKYPVGEKKKVLCAGEASCANCKTWACRKNNL